MTTELQWRRTWKPDLRSCPWQPMEIDGNTYLIKTRFTTDSYEFLFTDLSTIWVERLEETALRNRIKKLNPSLEAQTIKILDHIEESLVNPSKDTTYSLGFREDNDTGDGDLEKIRLTVNSKLAGMHFSWQFSGNPVDKETLSEHLTLPLLTMVGELFRRQKELMKIIAKKDKEIEDYKSQGMKTSRKHYETGMFDDTAFRHDMATSKEFGEQVKSLGIGAFVESGQDLYREILTKHAWFNRSPSGGEGTDSLSDDPSLNQALPSSGGTSWGNRLPPSLLPSSPRVSPQKSPLKPPSNQSTPESSPTKDTELMRRQALAKRLLEEEAKKESKAKKKKKIAF